MEIDSDRRTHTFYFTIFNEDESKLKVSVSELTQVQTDTFITSDDVKVTSLIPPTWSELESWDDFDKSWLRSIHQRLTVDEAYVTAFETWRETMSKTNDNFQFWNNYAFDDAPLFELFRVAIKTGDMRLRMWLRQRVLAID
eukprot:UN26575